MLAEALELHEGGGESIQNPDKFLRDELGINTKKKNLFLQ